MPYGYFSVHSNFLNIRCFPYQRRGCSSYRLGVKYQRFNYSLSNVKDSIEGHTFVPIKLSLGVVRVGVWSLKVVKLNLSHAETIISLCFYMDDPSPYSP